MRLNGWQRIGIVASVNNPFRASQRDSALVGGVGGDGASGARGVVRVGVPFAV
jgi:hypothetical protein